MVHGTILYPPEKKIYGFTDWGSGGRRLLPALHRPKPLRTLAAVTALMLILPK
jgi:hypothetical protein